MILNVVVALPVTVQGLRFQGPVPTDSSRERALRVNDDDTKNNNHPKPTPAPLIQELRKRQTSSSPATCGWVDGEWCTYSSLRAFLLYSHNANPRQKPPLYPATPD